MACLLPTRRNASFLFPDPFTPNVTASTRTMSRLQVSHQTMGNGCTHPHHQRLKNTLNKGRKFFLYQEDNRKDTSADSPTTLRTTQADISAVDSSTPAFKLDGAASAAAGSNPDFDRQLNAAADICKVEHTLSNNHSP